MNDKKRREPEKAESESTPKESTLREYFVTTVVCTIFALFVTTYVVHPMTVPTPSMVPTILVGDRLLIDKFTIRNSFHQGAPVAPVHDIKRGDILVFKFPENPEVLYVKRLIGLPGETLEIIDKTVYINGQALDEPYKHHSDPNTFKRSGGPHSFLSEIGRDNFGPITIPENQLFMMGDNRDNSADSRYFGMLSVDYVVGRPLFVFWSFEDDERAYQRTDILRLYAERIIFFVTRTRWLRTFHMVE